MIPRGVRARLLAAEVERERAAPDKEYGPAGRIDDPITTTARKPPDGPERTGHEHQERGGRARESRNNSSERPFRPRRSLANPPAATEATPTPGKIALMPAE